MTEPDPDSADEPADDRRPIALGLVAALPIELGGFFAAGRKLQSRDLGGFPAHGVRCGGRTVAAIECGLGADRAADATRALLAEYRPGLVLSVGFCGGLTDAVSPGDIAAPENVLLFADGEPAEVYRLSPVAAADPAARVHGGRLLTLGHVVRTVAEKRRLAEKYKGSAVDMEAGGVVAACTAAAMPCGVLKAATDDLAADLPAEVMSILAPTGSLRLGAAVGSVVRRPGAVKDLWRLRETAKLAADRLGSVLASLCETLDEPESPSA